MASDSNVCSMSSICFSLLFFCLTSCLSSEMRRYSLSIASAAPKLRIPTSYRLLLWNSCFRSQFDEPCWKSCSCVGWERSPAASASLMTGMMASSPASSAPALTYDGRAYWLGFSKSSGMPRSLSVK